MGGRKAKLKLSEKAYKDSNPGIVGQTKNRNVKKDSLYNQNGLLLSNGLDLCDCLVEDCPGCHFPCPRLASFHFITSHFTTRVPTQHFGFRKKGFISSN